MYRIHQIKLKLNEEQSVLPQKILKKLGRSDLIIKEWRIAKESIDARDKSNICRVYSLDFLAVYKKEPNKKAGLAANDKLSLEITPDTTYRLPEFPKGLACGDGKRKRPIVVGFGPAGMFAALILAQAGLGPIVLERGQCVEERSLSVRRFWESAVLNPQSNVQFGEGGAGTFSDGKLTTGIKDPRIHKVLTEFVNAGAPEDILYKQKPHIGTDILRAVVRAIREEIIRLGGEVRFNVLVKDIIFEDCGSADGAANDEAPAKRLCGLRLAKLDETGNFAEEETLTCDTAIFAIGHSARDTFRMLNSRGIAMRQKPFSIGVRIEHPQELIDRAQYGAAAGQLGLPPADYKLSHRCENGRGVYTFCMCPGGEVIAASSQEGGVVTNGMSYHDRASGRANSALLCDVRTSDFGSEDVLAGVEFQEKYEKLAFENGGGGYKPPHSTWGELRDGKAAAVANSLPGFAIEAMKEAMPHLGRKLRGFDSDDAVVSAVESRSSSPVRFERNEDYEGSISVAVESAVPEAYADTLDSIVIGTDKVGTESLVRESGEAVATASLTRELSGAAAAGTLQVLHGFYPCGEGAGYAGGITSAAVDGIRVAEAVIRNLQY